MSATVRPYEARDRGAVRAICVANGALPERSRPEDWLFADYWTRYYTDREPGHVWVADARGTVTGYLTAAFDTARYRRDMKRRVLPGILVRSALRGTIADPRSRAFILRRIAAWSNMDADPAGLLERFPGHLHVNLAEEARGAGLGAALVEACLAEGRRNGVAGFHLETMSDNARAIRFFEKLGFTEIGRRFPFRHIDPAQADRAVLVYGRPL